MKKENSDTKTESSVIGQVKRYLFLHGIYGVREGTVAAAIFVGTISRQINKPLGRLGERVFTSC